MPKLPDFLIGYRILYVADFHFNDRFPEFAPLVRDLLATVESEICLFGGDYRFAHDGDFAHVFRDMAVVLEGVNARHGVHAILGNHDLSDFVEPFQSLGIDILVNENRRIDAGEGSFWVAGVDDQHRFHCESLPLATEGIPPDDFTLLLAHSPELAMRAPNSGIDLYLCGHTHWGQIRFPVLGALTYNSRCPSRFCMGIWESEGMLGYTTAGIGTTDLPIRYNCPPEASLLTLARL
ncbi:MAG: metallophosphoesterase [Candidatus Hydrogenedentes bacterium]|nr:metallophosphoesterase [Candidatus Hydrogenedentota bacterium]